MSLVTLIRKRVPKIDLVWSFFTPILGLDKRSLALWRICLGLVTFGDLVNRSCDLHALYTDYGVTSRMDTITHWSSNYYFVVHFANGSWLFQALLFAFHMYCALAFAIGYKTKLYNFLSWFLLISLQSYMPFVGHGGDQYHRILLFWAMFLPTSEYWSVDALLKDWSSHQFEKRKVDREDIEAQKKSEPIEVPKEDTQFLSVASVGLISHLFLCYSISTYHKTGNDWHVDVTATYFALNLEFFQLPLARVLLQFPSWVLGFFTSATLWWEFWGPFFFIVPYKTAYFRIVGSLLFAAMHFGFGTCLRLGLFFWITTFNFTAFLPPLIWDHFLPWITTSERTQILVSYNPINTFSSYIAMFLSLFMFQKVEFRPNTNNVNYHSHFETIQSSNHGTIDLEANGHPNPSIWLHVETSDGKLLVNYKALVHCIKSTFLLKYFGALTSHFPQRLESFLSNTFDSLFQIAPKFDQFSFQLQKKKKKKMDSWESWQFIMNTTFKILCQLLLAYMIYLTVCWNFANVGGTGYPLFEQSKFLIWYTRMDQQWNMFSPNPPHASFFYTMPAELVSGKKVELWRNGAFFNFIPNDEVIWDPPSDWKASFRSHRWFKFFENGFNGENRDWLRLSTGRFICREFNSRAESVEDQIWTFNIYYNTNHVDVEGTKNLGTKQLLWSHQCLDSRPHKAEQGTQAGTQNENNGSETMNLKNKRAVPF